MKVVLPLIAAALILSGCASSETVPPAIIPPDTGTVIGSADVLEAPAVAFAGGRWLTFWIGSDESGVHHDGRALEITGAAGEPVILPLPPRHPFAQTAFASAGAVHLLWLDADDASPDANRLFTALISADLTVERGPTALSGAPTQHYAAIERGDGGLWAVWSAGIEGSMAARGVYLAPVDAFGRPRPAQLIADNATFPALVRAPDGVLWLIWLEQASGAFWRARIDETGDGSTGPAEYLSSGLFMARGDRIDSIFASADQAGVLYVVINVTRQDQSAESWVMHSRGDLWTAPVRLQSPSGMALRQVRPASGTEEPLLAGVTEDGIITFGLERARVVEQQIAVPGAAPLRPPQIILAGDQQMITWSMPNAEGAASLHALLTPRR